MGYSKPFGGAGGTTLTIDGIPYKDKINLKLDKYSSIMLPTPPVALHNSEVIEYKGELHFIGGTIFTVGSRADGQTGQTYHYKWDGSAWTSVATLPVGVYNCKLCILNDEIHLLRGVTRLSYVTSSDYSTTYNDNHYKWNGSSWTSVSTLPSLSTSDMYVVYVLNNEIHTKFSWNHYKYDGSAWTKVSMFNNNTDLRSCDFYKYNNKLYYIDKITIDSVSAVRLLSFNGTEWSIECTTPFTGVSNYPILIEYNNELHILNYTSHYRWNGVEWTKINLCDNLSTAINAGYGKKIAIVSENKLHLISVPSSTSLHFVYDGLKWEQLENLKMKFYYQWATGIKLIGNSCSSLINYNNKIHQLNGDYFLYMNDSYEQV